MAPQKSPSGHNKPSAQPVTPISQERSSTPFGLLRTFLDGGADLKYTVFTIDPAATSRNHPKGSVSARRRTRLALACALVVVGSLVVLSYA